MNRLSKEPEIPVSSATFVINMPEEGFLTREADAPVMAKWVLFHGGIRAWRREGHEHVTLLRAMHDERGILLGPPFTPEVPKEEVEVRDVPPWEVIVVVLGGGGGEIKRLELPMWMACRFMSQ